MARVTTKEKKIPQQNTLLWYLTFASVASVEENVDIKKVQDIYQYIYSSVERLKKEHDNAYGLEEKKVLKMLKNELKNKGLVYKILAGLLECPFHELYSCIYKSIPKSVNVSLYIPSLFVNLHTPPDSSLFYERLYSIKEYNEEERKLFLESYAISIGLISTSKYAHDRHRRRKLKEKENLLEKTLQVIPILEDVLIEKEPHKINYKGLMKIEARKVVDDIDGYYIKKFEKKEELNQLSEDTKSVILLLSLPLYIQTIRAFTNYFYGSGKKIKIKVKIDENGNVIKPWEEKDGKYVEIKVDKDIITPVVKEFDVSSWTTKSAKETFRYDLVYGIIKDVTKDVKLTYKENGKIVKRKVKINVGEAFRMYILGLVSRVLELYEKYKPYVTRIRKY